MYCVLLHFNDATTVIRRHQDIAINCLRLLLCIRAIPCSYLVTLIRFVDGFIAFFVVSSWHCRYGIYKMSLLSSPRALQLYREDEPHPPGHPITAAVLSDTIRDSSLYLTAGHTCYLVLPLSFPLIRSYIVMPI